VEQLLLTTNQTVKRPKMAVALADAIAKSILKDGLKPGQVLPREAQMMERYGVSRGTVREALRLLEAEELIVVRPGPTGGPVVQEPSPDRLASLLSMLLSISGTALRDVMQARQILEPALAARAATQATAAEIDRISASVKRLAETVDNQPLFLEINSEFHTLIVNAAGNRALMAFWHAIREISDGHEIGVRYAEAALKGTLRAHKLIAAAIADRDPERAAAAMTAHMDAHRRYLATHYSHLLADPIRWMSLR
jgi:GntR family transcriptional regulator, transcriptional repressor for pyruvate dehydrogenase complex